MSKFALVLTSALLLVNPSVVAEPVPSKAPKVQTFTFEKVQRNVHNVPVRPKDRKRAETVTQRLDNLDFLYYANVSLGTPEQALRLHLDTGSSDIWVESASSDLCRSEGNPCASTGTFDREKSSTYERVSGDFQISYVDGEYANGDYGKDTFTFGDGNKVRGLQFGIGLESTSTEGIMGIGMAENEVQVQRLGKKPYPNLVDLMVEQGLINTKAYSLWLNSLNAPTGEVLFGGIDRAKYTGELHTVPLAKRSRDAKAREFIISLTGVGLTNEHNHDLNLTDESFSIPVLLDTGSTYTYLPSDLSRAITEQVGATTTTTSSVPIVPCDAANYRGTINFSFNGHTIKVGMDQLTVKAYTNSGNSATYSDGADLCYFGIMDSGDDTYVLGDTFLRSAYVVYDIDKEEIGLAQTKFDVSDSDVMEIGKGKTLLEAIFRVSGSASANETSLDAVSETETSGFSDSPSPTLTRLAMETVRSSSGPSSSAATSNKKSAGTSTRMVAGLQRDTVILGASMLLTLAVSMCMF